MDGPFSFEIIQRLGEIAEVDSVLGHVRVMLLGLWMADLRLKGQLHILPIAIIII